MKDSNGNPILSLALPAGAPAKVKKAQAEFDRVATEVARLHGVRSDARGELEAAVRLDAREYAQRLAVDMNAVPADSYATAVKSEIALVEAKLPLLAEIADKAGDELVEIVGQALLDGWIDDLNAEEHAAAQDVQDAITGLEQALDKFTRAKAASAWANAFDVKAAKSPGWSKVADVRFRPNAPVAVPVRFGANAPKQNGVPLVAPKEIIAGLRLVTTTPELKSLTNEPARVV
jgi:hypothetical protein